MTSFRRCRPSFHELALLVLLTRLAAAATAASAAPAAKPGILLLGDSMMRVGVGPVLKKTLSAQLGLPVEMRAKSATGLTRNDVYDWQAELGRLLTNGRYERAVVMIGANDCQALSDAAAGGKAVPFGTPRWQEIYRRRVHDFAALLCTHVKDVVWLGLPPMRNAKLNARVRELNGWVEAEIKQSSCATYLPVTPMLADARGNFAALRSIKRRRVRIREDDGVHITQGGGQLVAQELLKSPPP